MSFSVDSTIAGIHSRSERTVRVSRDYDRGRTTKDILDAAFESDSIDLVNLEMHSGITRISEGQLLWQDLLRPLSENISGLKNGADLSRWYDTNSFYRKPSVIKKLAAPKDASFIKNYILSSALDLVKDDGKAKKKIALPGPYTLASLVSEGGSLSRVVLTEEFASILRKIVLQLVNSGFGSIQFNEPSLVYRYGESAVSSSRDLRAFISAFEMHLSKLSAEVSLHTYFGDCSKILKSLIRLDGVSTIGVDFTQTSLDSIEGVRFGEKKLACGCVDGRNSLVEPPEWISSFCAEAIQTLKPSGIVVQPSCELKYLPRVFADQKIQSIGKACKILESKLD
jgi:methionine synthase II (cobalamin-independent)